MTGILQHPGVIPTGSDPGAGVEVQDRCTPAFLAAFEADPGLGAFGHYAPQASTRQLGALVRVAGLPQSRVLVAYVGRRVVAYLTFHPAERDSRWASLPPGQILELGGIEVSRSQRGRGLARRLMDQAFSTPDFEPVIVYAQALTWCWDLEGSGLSKADYRRLMLKLFAPYGFQAYTTDEPNIRCDGANLLLARLGPRVPTTLRDRFHSLLIQRSGEW